MKIPRNVWLSWKKTFGKFFLENFKNVNGRLGWNSRTRRLSTKFNANCPILFGQIPILSLHQTLGNKMKSSKWRRKNLEVKLLLLIESIRQSFIVIISYHTTVSWIIAVPLRLILGDVKERLFFFDSIVFLQRKCINIRNRPNRMRKPNTVSTCANVCVCVVWSEYN